MSTPSITTLPRSGLSSPIRVFSSTDLPVPEGPSITQISPAGTVRVTSPQMSCLPKDLVRPSIWISTPMGLLPSQVSPATRGSRPCYPGSTGSAPISYALLRTRCAERDPSRWWPGTERAEPGHPLQPPACARAGAPVGTPALGAVCVRPASLERDGGAGALEGLLGLLGSVLGDALENRLRGGLDQVLGLLQTEGGQGAHLLDHVDLLVARRLQDDVELVLLGGLVGSGATSGAAGGGSGGDGDRSGRGHAEGVLELLDELTELDQRHLLERVEQLVGAELRHGGVSFRSVVSPCGGPGCAVGYGGPVVGQASVVSLSSEAAV